MSKKPTYIDLFCGSGGFSVWFDVAGFKNIFSLDIEPSFCATYEQNFPWHTLIKWDIKNLSPEDIFAIAGNQEIDVIIGWPPCQGFSMAGNIGRRFIEDPRNQLFQEFARVVSIVKPNYFVMENVARLATHNQGRTKEEILTLFGNMGYHVDCKIVNSADYGVAQVRKRVLFIGSKNTDTIIFPEREAEKDTTVIEVLQKYPPLVSWEGSKIPNHTAMNHSEQMLEKMSYVTDGWGRNDIPEMLRPQKWDSRKYIRYTSNKPSICITGDMRKVFHYSQNRALTVRELAALQSYPDDFVFMWSTISQQQQVGNSVPPLMAEAIARSIRKMKKNEK